MGKRFILFKEADNYGQDKYYVGVEVRIAGHSMKYPFSKGCNEYVQLVEEIESLQRELEEVKEESRAMFSYKDEIGELNFPPGTPPDQIWHKLCAIDEEEGFVAGFNSLTEVQRKEVAEYVLTRCNVFSGKASVFSARYNNKSTFLE